VNSDEYEKESIGDFALWKVWTEGDGEVFWESPWGRGRPGWHIECSAMATALLGPQLDIHCGGVDNIFPHHEAEIAQSECVTGKRFVRYWLHCAHLLVDSQKMSKSAGNFYTLRDLLNRGYTGREIRYALLGVHYRLPLNFTLSGLDGARAALGRMDAWVLRLRNLAAQASSETLPSCAEKEQFLAALDDDLNISEALAVLFDWIRETNRLMDAEHLSAEDAARILADFGVLNEILGVTSDPSEIPEEVERLSRQREEARVQKDWKRSDHIRDELAKLGWAVKDTKNGAQLSRIP
jgi:cysteinyl-tRNA synthetase